MPKPKKKEPTAAVATPKVPLAGATGKATRGISLMLQVGLITLPVKLYTGARAESVSFKKIHTTCLSPTKNQETPGQMFCPMCQMHVPGEEISKGYEVEKGSYVLLTEEEIVQQKPDTDKLVAIDKFVPAADIDPIYFQSSYYLSPGDIAAGGRAFVLIREMLQRADKVALGKATLYGNEHTVILRPFGKGLALHQLYHLTELNTIGFGVDTVEVSAQELALAGSLVEQMSGDFEPEQYHDRYLKNIQELVAAKQAGTAPKLPEKITRTGPVDLMAALTQSLKVVKKVA
jgi:DNA end-binding protein Ku